MNNQQRNAQQVRNSSIDSVWIGTWESGGNQHLIVHRREILVKRDMLNAWEQHHKAVKLGPECPAYDCAWEEFADFTGAYVQELPFGKELEL